MRYFPVLAFVGCLAVLGQVKPPLGILRAELLAWDGSWDDGVLRLRLDSGLNYECAFDGRSFFERDRIRISPGRLRPGDQLEVMSDRTTQSSKCFARRIKVILPNTAEEQFAWGSVTRATEHFAPRGSLTYTGAVSETFDDRFVLRLRGGGRQTIRLRRDTRFFQNGSPASKEALAVNMQVHVRAGFNPDDEVEAYQVFSGEILQPQSNSARQP